MGICRCNARSRHPQQTSKCRYRRHSRRCASFCAVRRCPSRPTKSTRYLSGNPSAQLHGKSPISYCLSGISLLLHMCVQALCTRTATTLRGTVWKILLGGGMRVRDYIQAVERGPSRWHDQIVDSVCAGDCGSVGNPNSKQQNPLNPDGMIRLIRLLNACMHLSEAIYVHGFHRGEF